MNKFIPSDFKVLIVDDIARNIQILTNLLALEDYQTFSVDNGRDAIKAVESNNYDIILLDIMMPEMNGYEVAGHLKKDQRFKDIPIIFITAIAETENIVKGFELGGVDYITKPFSETELLARLRTHLELKNSKDIIAQNYKHLEQQKQEIEFQNNEITAGINYASRIQNALLPSKKTRYNYLPNHFLIWQPKAIVSGDFFWMKKIREYVITAIVDCTGHGVPGAFMSLLGITFLNEIVNEQNISSPNIILNTLRKQLKIALGQNGADSETKDGMDVALISLNIEQKKLHYSGANNSIYIIRNKELPKIEAEKIKISYNNNYYLYQIIHDSMPIGIYHIEHDFSLQDIDILEGDQIYAFTDGFIDQFGGKNNKKFKSKQFKKLLLDNCHKEINEQKKSICETFKDWKSNNEQVDDILIMGFKI
ncbi:MAG: response regulator [Bacteroidales bacterium]|nr:response regulator [Bacteroidales bacterium]